ncbi:NAD(P)H-binding protein [Streptomyces sp. QL37]|uniref:NAD(P)H-binding protein n=1 Tax=Streptomyces sp. QL37 TaxID=2093747 RepID=UPI000CF2F181|nr:NAD(P)H-binding protein [Streptomyces sp. QL37]PPQ60594.1 NAD(P)-dependent oxidoreductase [Streptomyces sp. QL37]
MILVTGATGTVGREVARQLAADHAVRLMSRTPARPAVSGPRVETVVADFARPDSLTRALSGVRAAFLVTCHPAEPHDERFLEAAVAEGVGHVVKLSAAVVGDDTDDFLTLRQRAMEEEVRSCGIGWTLLRPRAFMSNTLSWADSIGRDGTVGALYGNASNAPVDPRDVARVAVRALTEREHAGRTYTLVGPEQLSAREQARILGEALGRPLRFREWTVREARERLAQSYPPPVVEALMKRAALQAGGGKALRGDALASLTGRAAGTFRGWADDHAHRFPGS